MPAPHIQPYSGVSTKCNANAKLDGKQNDSTGGSRNLLGPTL